MSCTPCRVAHKDPGEGVRARAEAKGAGERNERLGMIISPGILGNHRTSCTFRVQWHVEKKRALLMLTRTAWEQDISVPQSR